MTTAAAISLEYFVAWESRATPIVKSRWCAHGRIASCLGLIVKSLGPIVKSLGPIVKSLGPIVNRLG